MLALTSALLPLGYGTHGGGPDTKVMGADIVFPPFVREWPAVLRYAVTEYEGLNGLIQRTRMYNGFPLGPTIRVKPGETFQIRLENALPDMAFDTSAIHNMYKGFHITNMHTHGLHVSGKDPGDNPLVEVHPGESRTYTYHVPDSHMPGTHWYHPHQHGSTAVQAGGGASGLLIVDDPPGYLPPQIEALEEMQFLLLHMAMPELTAIAKQAEVSCQEIGGTVEQCKDDVWAAGPVAGNQTNIVVVNGQPEPTVRMKANVWYRWRVLFAAVSSWLELSITCEWKLLSKDGIYLNVAPRDINVAWIGPGARADLLVNCPAGTHTVTSQPTPREDTEVHGEHGRRMTEGHGEAGSGGGGPPPGAGIVGSEMSDGIAQDIMTVIATDEGDEKCELPTFEVNRPCYLVDLTKTTPTANIPYVFGPGIQVNNRQFHSATDYDHVIDVGHVYEYNLKGVHVHPFHMHVYPYQIADWGETENPSTSDGFFMPGDWHDTLLTTNKWTNVRLQTEKYTGTVVSHCHILAHEDLGMMVVGYVNGEEGTVWEGAREIDPTCYRGATFAPSRILPSNPGTCVAPELTTEEQEGAESGEGGDSWYNVAMGEAECDNGCLGGIIGGCVALLLIVLWLGGALPVCPSPCQPKPAAPKAVELSKPTPAAVTSTTTEGV
jgi:FtsP/CotA-like multicopper oxidase with cupredoxin domain